MCPQSSAAYDADARSAFRADSHTRGREKRSPVFLLHDTLRMSPPRRAYRKQPEAHYYSAYAGRIRSAMFRPAGMMYYDLMLIEANGSTDRDTGESERSAHTRLRKSRCAASPLLVMNYRYFSMLLPHSFQRYMSAMPQISPMLHDGARTHEDILIDLCRELTQVRQPPGRANYFRELTSFGLCPLSACKAAIFTGKSD